MDRVERGPARGARRLIAAAVVAVALALPGAARAQALQPDADPVPARPRPALPRDRALPGGIILRQGDARANPSVTLTPIAREEQMPWEPARLAGIAPDPAVTALVRQLDAADWAGRARATEALLDRAVPDDQVWVHLARGGLSPEAHSRLLHVGTERIMHAPRGALGIQMAARFEENDGVVVTGLVPGMPAQKVLKPGDRIVRIEGQRIQVSQQLTSIVQERRPGDRIKVVVMRGERDELGRVKGGPDGKPLETQVDLELELGSREDLDRLGDGNAINDAPLVEAKAKLRALKLAEAFPVPTAVLPVEALPGERPDVDSHPEIVQLKEVLSRAERDKFKGGLRNVLRARLAELEARARVPGLAENERAWLEAVATRFRELTPPEYLDPVEPGPSNAPTSPPR